MHRIETRYASPRCPRTRVALATLAATVFSLGEAVEPAEAVVQTFSEDFTTTSYEDTEETTASWDTSAGEIGLHPFALLLAGTHDTSGSAGAVVLDGNYAFVADGVAGLKVIDISDPAFPLLLGTYDTPNLARDVTVAGDHAFVADQSNGLVVIDVSDPSNPTLAGSLDTGDFARGITVAGDHALVADGASGLLVIDISDPTTPVLVGTYDTQGNAQDVAVSGDHAFVADQGSGLLVIDISDPTNPTLLGSYDTVGTAVGVAVSGDLAFVADGSSGLQVVEISDPTSPAVTGSYDTSGSSQGVWVAGDHVFVADGFSGLQMIDVTDPANPVLEGSYDTADFAAGVAVSGDHAFVANSGTGLVVVQASRPVRPMLAGRYDGLPRARNVAVAGDHAFVADGLSGLAVIDIRDPLSPSLAGTYASSAFDIAVSGDHVFLAAIEFGLVVVDISDPLNPTLAGSLGVPVDVSAYGVAVDGDHAFVASAGPGGVGGLMVVDVSDPADPAQIGFYDTPGIAIDVVIAGNLAFVADGDAGLTVVDISDPTNPTFEGGWGEGPVLAQSVAVAGDVAFVADSFGHLHVIDVADPVNPVLTASYSTAGSPLSVAADGDRVYVADEVLGLLVFDVRDPSNPILADSYETTDDLHGLTLAGDLAFVAALQSGFQVIQVHQRVVADESANGQSLEIDGDTHTVVRVRLTTTQTPGVAWELSGNGGEGWSAVTPGGSWMPLGAPGADLRWRSTHTWLPGPSATASALTVDWLNDFGPIGSITDVENDQGRQVRITWRRSGYDFVGDENQIVEYSIYRRVDSEEQQTAPDGSGGILESNVNPPGWDFVLTVPADAEEEYSVVAPTLADSTEADGTRWSTFMVRARVSAGLFYDSPPDSGYSIDNLEPGVPMNLIFGEPEVLVWDEAPEEDFAYHTVYGSEIETFDENAILISYTVDPTYDVSGSPFGYYHVTTSDLSGNEGGAAGIQSPSSSVDPGAGPPLAFALETPSPNPLRTMTMLRFDLPEAARIHLAVYDVVGRQVQTLATGPRDQGRYVVTWDGLGRNGLRVPAGSYFARLDAGVWRAKHRVVVMP